MSFERDNAPEGAEVYMACEGRMALLSGDAMFTRDEFDRRYRLLRESAEGQELEDLLLLAAVEEQPESAPPAVDAELYSYSENAVQKRGSYMVADVDFERETVRVEFVLPIPIATELIGHALNMEEYDEAQLMVNQFIDKITDVIGRALFGPSE